MPSFFMAFYFILFFLFCLSLLDIDVQGRGVARRSLVVVNSSSHLCAANGERYPAQLKTEAAYDRLFPFFPLCVCLFFFSNISFLLSI